jgi:hypothetical protein
MVLYDLIDSKLSSADKLLNLVNNRQKLEENISFIAKQPVYISWIPNNGGFLNWSRIGVATKGRFLISTSSATKEGEKIPPITVIDMDVDTNDYIPSPIAELAQKTTGSEFLKPVFITEIYFRQKCSNSEELCDVNSGQGHLVKDGVYEAKAKLLYFPKKVYEKIKKTSGSVDSLTALLKDDNNQPFYAFEVNYKVESKGKILLSNLRIKTKFGNSLDIESFSSKEGYKGFMQLMYGLIKRTFHGDNHHHHKDDVILKVYADSNSEFSSLIPLVSMIEHLKGLEKIEKNRNHMLCQQFVPNYTHEADGIVAYATMYYENYIKGKQQVISDGERYLKAILSIHKSLKSIVDRNNELFELTVNHKRSGRNLFMETPTYLLLIAVISLLLGTEGFRHISNDNEIINYSIVYMSILLSQVSSFVFITSLFILLIYRKTLILCYCKNVELHKDYRPKDKYFAYVLSNRSRFVKFYHFIFYVILFILISSVFSITFYII